MYSQLISQFASAESLPETYSTDAGKWFVPLAELCLDLIENVPGLPVTIGINGCQGSGKSTLAALLKTLLAHHGRQVAVLSIDDFYLPSAARKKLAAEVHPLLVTRGVPGTHDLGLALDCLTALGRLRAGDSLALPSFDKASDEPRPRRDWPILTGPVDLIILEGWFIGCSAQADEALEQPVNALEANEDRDKTWRQWINTRLGQDYQTLFAHIDVLIMLRAPGFDSVFGWRQRQEEKLGRRLQKNQSRAGLMGDEQLQRFIQHYERLTRHCLDTLPRTADIVFQLDEQQRVTGRRDRDSAGE